MMSGVILMRLLCYVFWIVVFRIVVVCLVVCWDAWMRRLKFVCVTRIYCVVIISGILVVCLRLRVRAMFVRIKVTVVSSMVFRVVIILIWKLWCVFNIWSAVLSCGVINV